MSSSDSRTRAIQDRRRLDRLVVGQAIHHHLAEDGPDPVLLGGAERAVHRRLVHGAIGEERGGPGGRERAERRGREAGGVLGVVEPALQREDVAAQPGEQVQAGAEPGVGELRQVRVQVDHAGQQDERPEVDRRRRAGRGGARARASQSSAPPTHSMRPLASTATTPSG